MLATIPYAIAIIITALCALHGLKLYIHARVPRALTDASISRLERTDQALRQFEAQLAQHNAAQANMAKDWLAKFRELEAQWATLEENVGSKVAGTLAQLPTRGFNR